MNELDVYFENNPDFGADDFAAWVQLTEAMRRLMDISTKLNADKDTLAALAQKVELLEQEMSAHAGRRPVSAFNPMCFDDIAKTSPFCPVMGELSPLSPPVDVFFEGDKVVGLITFDDLYQGPPNCVHGGIVAATWDLLLAYACMTERVGGPTAYITIHYRQLTPLHKLLRFEAYLERKEGKKLFTKGTCYCDDEIVTEAEGLFINTVGHMYAMESNRTNI